MAQGTKLGYKALMCKSLQGYLKSLPKETLNKLYNFPATCLAVFRCVTIIYNFIFE